MSNQTSLSCVPRKYIATFKLLTIFKYTDQSKIVPTIVTYKKGEDITIGCSSQNKEKTRWYFNNGPLPKNALPIPGQKHVLLINKVKEEHEGFYECIGTTTTRSGEEVLFSASTMVVKKGKIYPLMLILVNKSSGLLSMILIVIISMFYHTRSP